MASVQLILTNRAIGAIVCALWIFVIVSAQPTLAASQIQVSPSSFQVHWSEPKCVRLIDKTHGRFLIEGKADPGVEIQIEPNAVVIDPPESVQKLTIENMAPSFMQTTVGKSGRFKILLTLPFQRVEIPFQATISQLPTQHYVLAVLANKLIFKQSSRWNFGLEVRSVNYSQTNLSNLNEIMLAPVVSYQEQFAKRWSFQATTFIDVARDTPLATNQNNDMVQFWDSSANVIYSTPLKSPKWSVGIAGGFYYMTTYSSGASFGFTNLWGPEIYPIFRFAPNNKNIFDFYFKYDPVLSQMPFNISNNESNVGIEWTKSNRAKRSISFKLELLQDALTQGSSSTRSTAVNLDILFGVP